MRVLVLGAGAVGGYFGGRMAEAGADITFLVRPARAEALADGLHIGSLLGDAHLPVRTILAGEPADPFDAIIVSCKSYGLPGAMDAIAPHVGAETAIWPLLNGYDHLATLDARFPGTTVWGGIAHIGATLGPEGQVRHFNRFNRITLGLRQGQEGTRFLAEQAIALARSAPHVTAVLADDIDQALWDKWVMLASLAAGTCLMRGSVGTILETRYGAKLLKTILDEVVAIASAEGQCPAPDQIETTRSMLSEQGSAWTASMLRDMQQGAPTEADHILGTLLDRAARHGIPVPMLSTAYSHLQVYEAGRTP